LPPRNDRRSATTRRFNARFPCPRPALLQRVTDQGQERHDKTGGGGEQVNIAMPKAAIPNVVLPCRDLTVSYNRPYSASLGSQGAVREDSEKILRLRNT
jgi:hypothetical protein